MFGYIVAIHPRFGSLFMGPRYNEFLNLPILFRSDEVWLMVYWFAEGNIRNVEDHFTKTSYVIVHPDDFGVVWRFLALRKSDLNFLRHDVDKTSQIASTCHSGREVLVVAMVQRAPQGRVVLVAKSCSPAYSTSKLFSWDCRA